MRRGGGALASSPRCVRILAIDDLSRIAALIFSSPPQFGKEVLVGASRLRRLTHAPSYLLQR